MAVNSMDSESDNAHRISTTGYELNIGTFRGPLEKLLGLIEAKELEITQLSLAEVTADFLEYVRTLTEVDPRVLTDFIVIAARLILIKSRAILPQLTLSDEEEEDIADLEDRLRIYREFKRAEAHIEGYWRKRSAHAREYLLELPSGFYLTEKVSPRDLHRLVERFYSEFQPFIPKIEEGMVAFVSLEEMIEEMIIRVHIGPPPIPGSTDNRVTIGTANGVTLSAPFSR